MSFVAGIFTGAILGILVVGLCVACAVAERNDEICELREDLVTVIRECGSDSD